jgi:hypothetical protein
MFACDYRSTKKQKKQTKKHNTEDAIQFVASRIQGNKKKQGLVG